MSQYWSPAVRDLTPYIPGEQPREPGFVKLNTNENPYGPSPRAIAAMQAEINDGLRLYPDPNGERLKQAVADYYGVTPAQVFVGNGSDEVLAHAFHGLFQHGRPLLFPDVTYSFYPVYCGLYGIEYETVALNEQFEIDVADYQRPNGGIIFPNPNAPTGCLLPLAAIERLLAANPDSVVLVDEASMVDSTLLEIALRCAHPFRTRLVFVGDPAQLPPVGEPQSPVFTLSRAASACGPLSMRPVRPRYSPSRPGVRLRKKPPPTSGNRPMLVSGMAILVRSVTMRSRAPWLSPMPPPITMPSMKATIGFSYSNIWWLSWYSS